MTDAVIALTGDVDATAEATLALAYDDAVAGGPAEVTLDFSGADYINSSGIALIVALLARARAQSVSVRARGLSDHYREIFEITRIVDFMTIEEERSP